jgi:ADP-heptose:LPS heptosyltransferase
MPLVGVHFGGRGSKRWPLEHFLALVNQLARDPHLLVVLFWGPEEWRLTREIRDAIPPNVIQMPLMPLRDFAAALQRCRLFIGTDSGPLHLAAAVGTTTIGIYTTQTFRHYRQLGSRHQALFHLGGTNVDAVVGAVRAALSWNDTSSTARMTRR